MVGRMHLSTLKFGRGEKLSWNDQSIKFRTPCDILIFSKDCIFHGW